ncbi:MAG TPA: hypothetical protein VFU86_23860 [Terriglobales bacterium]|nr:hypothetical protein [Terriglobales bacterium]
MKRQEFWFRMFAAPAFLFLVWLMAPANLYAGDVGKGACSTGASRQLDYWVGNWNVTSPGADYKGVSNVAVSMDKCLYTENWNNGKGHIGKNLFAYSPDDKTWYGMFADNEGRVHIFTDGKVDDGAAVFHGPSRSETGATVLNRITIRKVSPVKVERTWEKSTDNGATWNTVFQGEYTRPKL